MTAGKIVFRTDASTSLGMGHLYRSLALASAFATHGYTISFVVKNVSLAALDILRGYEVLQLAKRMSWDEENVALESAFGNKQYDIILDVSHAITFRFLNQFSAYTKSLGQVFEKRIIIDGFANTALLEKVEISAEMAITPYVGAKNRSLVSQGFIHLTGPKYMIFDSSYRVATALRKVAAEGARILLTFGGSDPMRISLMALEACDTLNERVEVRVVAGRGFDKELVESIKIKCAAMGKCKIIHSPSTLVDHMLWADIAVSASGLTKYELALCGTPAVLISVDNEHAAINHIFDSAGTSVDMGVFSDVTVSNLASAISGLLSNRIQRESLAQAGQALVDAFGTERIVSAVRALHVGD